MVRKGGCPGVSIPPASLKSGTLSRTKSIVSSVTVRLTKVNLSWNLFWKSKSLLLVFSHSSVLSFLSLNMEVHNAEATWSVLRNEQGKREYSNVYGVASVPNGYLESTFWRLNWSQQVTQAVLLHRMSANASLCPWIFACHQSSSRN